MQLRKARRVDLYVHVSAGNLEKFRVQFSGKKIKSSFMTVHWTPRSQIYYIGQVSALVFGWDACRVAFG